MPPSVRPISISVVSHGQGPLVRQFLADVARCCADRVEVIVTHNIPEETRFEPADWPFPLVVITNDKPRGFAANQNQAFHRSTGSFFCVANPDVRLTDDPFPALVADLARTDVGVVAPAVLNPAGEVEPSARKFPTIRSILRKVLAWKPLHDYDDAVSMCDPDWVAGTFMLFAADTYARIGGFDEKYFLYYEDVDICARLRSQTGMRPLVDPSVRIVHDAGRRSWTNPRFTMIHLRSMLRYFVSTRFNTNGAMVAHGRRIAP